MRWAEKASNFWPVMLGRTHYPQLHLESSKSLLSPFYSEKGRLKAISISFRRSADPLPSSASSGDGDGRGARLHGGWDAYSCRCMFASLYLPMTMLGSSSRVWSLLRFSDGVGIDAISGEGRRRLLLLLMLFVEDVDNGAFFREQEVRLGFLFPQIISGAYVFVGDGSMGSFILHFLLFRMEMSCSLLQVLAGILCFLHVFFVVFGGGSVVWWWLLEGWSASLSYAGDSAMVMLFFAFVFCVVG